MAGPVEDNGGGDGGDPDGSPFELFDNGRKNAVVHFVETVFERIGDRDGVVRKFALLADGNESSGQLMGDGPAQNEASRFDACDFVDFGA